MYTHTVRLVYDGITRDYDCRSYFDAVVLLEVMDNKYGSACVELRPYVRP